MRPAHRRSTHDLHTPTEVIEISDTPTAFRMTPQRDAVLTAVRTADDHPTADDIHRVVTSTSPGIGVATVYRTLDLLVRHGLISELRLGDEQVTRYDGNLHRHDHVVCATCGQVTDVDVSLPKDLISSAAAQAGVEVTGYDLQFRGTCQTCRT